MQQEQIPQLPVSEKTTWGELPDLLGAAVQICEEKFGGCPSVLIFQPIEQSNIPGYQPTISQAPEELIVVTVIPRIRDAALRALISCAASVSSRVCRLFCWPVAESWE